MGISGNNIVGYYQTSTNTYAFLYNGSNYTTLSVPGATQASANGIDGNNIVGACYIGSNWLVFLATRVLPTLSISQSSNTVTLLWPSVSGWALQQNADLVTTNWTASSGVTTTNGTNYLVVQSPTNTLFFRLQGE
jgi:hypothetical protein